MIKTHDDNSSTNSSTNNSTNNSNNDSATTLAKRLSDDDRQHFNDMYNSLDPDKMWTLSTGKKVEVEVAKYANTCSFEHLVHSFILDPSDVCWQQHFTPAELDEIRSAGVHDHLVMPPSLSNFLNTISATPSPKAAAKAAMRYDCDDDDLDIAWAQLAVQNGAIKFRTKDSINLANYSESGLLAGPWRFLFSFCDTSKIDVVAGNEQDDSVYVGMSRELGCLKLGHDNTTDILLAKTLKNILAALVSEKYAAGNDLVTVGFLVLGDIVQLMKVDCPAGYIGRLTYSSQYFFPRAAPEFSSDFVELVKLVWYAKERMERTLALICKLKSNMPFEWIKMPGDNHSSNISHDHIKPSYSRPTSP